MAEAVPVPPPKDGDLERFWRKVEKTDECWIWRGGFFSSGYGAFWLEGRIRRAHRVIYCWTHGEPGMSIDHECDNRACVRLDHLRAKPIKENTLRSKTAPTAVNARKNKPDCGHSEEFTYTDPRGWRGCTICRREAVRKHYEANRERILARRREKRRG